LNKGDSCGAIALLEEALQLARSLGDSSQLCDVSGNLGLALLVAGQLQRAQALFDQELALAWAADDRFAEIIALEHAGFTAVRRGEPCIALGWFQHALDVARALGDPKREADCLWHQALQHAEMGRKDLALRHG